MSIKSKSNKFIAILVVFLIMSTVLTPSALGEETTEFKDLSINEFGYNEVQSLTDQGIINGFNDHTFRPSLSIKRAEAAKLLVKSLQVQGDGNLALFKDVSKTSQWVPYIDAAIDNGIFNGFSDGLFGVDLHLTREQMASVLVRAYGLKPVPTKVVPLKDLDTSSSYHKEDIKTLYQNGITMGFDDQTFRPKEAVNRATFSVFLHRTLLNQMNIIEDVTANGVVINGELFAFDGTLQGLFTEGNLSALKNAEVEFETVENKISKVSKLVLNSSGTPGLLEEFDANVLLDLGSSVISGDVIVNGDYVTIKNGTIEGSLTISSNVENDFYMSNVMVKGGTYVNGGDSNTVVFDDSILSDLAVEKLNVRVKFTGETTIGTVTVNSNSVIEADSTIRVPLVEIGENVEKVLFVQTTITELSLLGTQQVTLEGLTNVGKLTLPSDVKVEDVIANYESIRSVLFNPPVDSPSTPVESPSSLPLYDILVKDFEGAKKSFAFSQLPYYYSYADVTVYLKVVREMYPTAKSYKVNYFPVGQPSKAITKDLFVMGLGSNFAIANEGIPDILKEFNLNESTLMQFNILVFDESGKNLETITHEQLVLDLTTDIELAFNELKADWANLSFESIRPFVENSNIMTTNEIDVLMPKVKLLNNPSISDINLLAKEVLLSDLPLEMYTNVMRTVEPLKVGSLLKGYENREVQSITSKNSSLLTVDLVEKPGLFVVSPVYEFVAIAPGNVDLDVVFKDGNTTETKTIHVEVADLADTLTEVNMLIIKRNEEKNYVNKNYLSDVMKYVLMNSSLTLDPTFLSGYNYEYIFNVFTTPYSKTSYISLAELQSEIDQITDEIAAKNTFKEVVIGSTNPISFDATAQKTFDVLGYIQASEFSKYMDDPRMDFSLQPSTRVPLPIGVTLDDRGFILILNDYNELNTKIRIVGSIYFGQYIRTNQEFEIDLDRVINPL